jgi:hypothetical protein
MPFGRANAIVDDLVSLAMEDGFEKSLLELAKVHENETGPWLENLESDVMANLKGPLATTAGVTADAEPVAAAAKQIETFFKEFRDSLQKE